MKKERIVQLAERMDAIIKSENIKKDELIKISLQLDMLIDESLENISNEIEKEQEICKILITS